MTLGAPGSTYIEGAFAFTDPELARIATQQGAHAAWMAAFVRDGENAPSMVTGEFSVGLRDACGRILLAVDRFSIRSLCFRIRGDVIDVHSRADVVAASDASLDNQAIFDYLYAHVIPAPRTIFKGVRRLPAGHCALLSNGKLRVAPWWRPVFVEDDPAQFAVLRDEFRRLLRSAVADQVDDRAVGCFLSGGTDSSTVAGMLSEVTGRPARTFSIGFDAKGYDEMEFARIAARHFKTDHHEYYVTADDLVASIPEVATSYDQPFGNSSVVPSYYCARFARESGIEHILGGDGGDELFGGNSRYAKQRIFEAYGRVPPIVRRGLLEPILANHSALSRIAGFAKAASYVDQARVPMPDRMQMYNLLTRLGLEDVLAPEFLAEVDPGAPLRQMREVYAAGPSGTLINRMLAFDWRFTLADNDLPKVVGATSLAGLSVGFPLLDDALTDFSLKLEPKFKLKGLQLRWFFKEALRGFLPDEILAKKKHGFGLPFGVWVNSHPALQSLAFESLRALSQRGIVRKEFIERLVNHYLPDHPGYYGEMVWVLMTLEQWLGRPAKRGPSRKPPHATTGDAGSESK
ncbi:MAG: asparagine synthase C-terminal domain-containing protein [Betaproteobacteria bacterium]